MKLTKLEWGTLAVTALTLVAMVCYFMGSRAAARPVTLAPQESVELPSASQAAEKAEEQKDGRFPIDLNTATEAELDLLPGIGEVKARAIVAYREEHGPFRYVEDLREVKGIGEQTLADIMEYVTVNGGEQSDGEDLSG